MSLRFYCNYCSASFPQIKELFEHYEAEHKNRDFKRYRIKHLPSGEQGSASAPTPEQACARLCWELKDCDVKEFWGVAGLISVPKTIKENKC